MSTKTMKILTTVATILLIVSMGASIVCATDIGPVKINPDTGAEGTTEIANIGNTIMGLIQVAGIVIAVVILMVLGIKYMMGSAEEKAEYKKTMIPYLVGAILIFAASTIANAVYKFANGLNK